MHFMLGGQQASTYQRGRKQLADALKKSPQAVDALARFDRYAPDLWDGLAAVYDVEIVWPAVIDVIASAITARPPALIERDRSRQLQPDWFQLPEAVGYVAYTDHFAGDLNGIETKIDYLNDLGITYLHLMPLLRPRTGENDGGYAVADYKSVRPDLGTIDDLESLATSLHANGIALTLDLVLNHVAEQHEWAVKARNGEEKYRNYFLMYPDRKVPDQYEATLPEVFPDFAPGNFTWDESSQLWVWTTFNSWQWDLNWANPDVFCEFVDILTYLANKGVDCFRLDAIAFLWKRLGTNSQNQPEVHSLTQGLRAALRIAAPSVIFKAEAIVAPSDLVAYLGTGEHAGKVSDLAYHNSLMVQAWSTLAIGEGRLMAQALQRFAPIPTTTAWATYLRCHDDIGWAIDDADAGAIGVSGYDHRAYISGYYGGELPQSPARGAHFQVNPLTGDRRTSGSAASLAGIESTIEAKDDQALDLAINRLMCGYSMIFGFGGLPLLYMGDEIGLLNDVTYRKNPALAGDNRWMHRPHMPWDVVAQRNSRATVAGQVFARMSALISARKSLASLHAATAPVVFATDNPAVVAFRRRHPAGDLVELYNVSAQTQILPTHSAWPLNNANAIDAITGSLVDLTEQTITMAPYAVWWLTAQPS